MATKKVKYDRVLAIDLGNGMVKMRGLDKKTGKLYVKILPSAWAYQKSVGSDVKGESLNINTFYFNNNEYVWGEDISEVDDLKVTYGLDNRYVTDAFKIMAKIVMAQMVYDLNIQPTEKILVVTGVPSNETNTSRVDDIKKAFIGEDKGIHEVDINENENSLIFKVAEVEVLPQAVSAVIDRYLDFEGYVEDEEYEELKVGIIDIGAGTTDLDIVKALRRQKAYDSVPRGFSNIYDAIREKIAETRPTHKVSDYKLLELIKQKSTEYYPSKRKSIKPIDFEDNYNKAIDELVIDIQQAIVKHWKDHSDMDEILLIGASAEGFEEKISNVIDGLTIPENPELSNVNGYYKWGEYLIMNSKGDA